MENNVKVKMHSHGFIGCIIFDLIMILTMLLLSTHVVFKFVNNNNITLGVFISCLILYVFAIAYWCYDIMKALRKYFDVKYSFRGFCIKSDVLFRSNQTTFSGVIIDKKIIDDDYCLLLRNDNKFIVVSVDSNIYYCKNISDIIAVDLNPGNMYVPGYLVSKYSDQGLLYIQIANKYGIFEYEIDQDKWNNIDNPSYTEKIDMSPEVA